MRVACARVSGEEGREGRGRGGGKEKGGYVTCEIPHICAAFAIRVNYPRAGDREMLEAEAGKAEKEE